MPARPADFAPLQSIDDIKRQHEYFGSHWFEKDTMRFFQSCLCSTHVYPSARQRCTYFVTSECPPEGARAWSVRKAEWDKVKISTAGEFLGYRSMHMAGAAAKQLAERINMTEEV